MIPVEELPTWHVVTREGYSGWIGPDVYDIAPFEQLDPCAGCGFSKAHCEDMEAACPGCDCQTMNPLWGPILFFEHQREVERLAWFHRRRAFAMGLLAMTVPSFLVELMPFDPLNPYPMPQA